MKFTAKLFVMMSAVLVGTSVDASVTVKQWASQQPALIRKTNGCGSANVCIGQYEVMVSDYGGTSGTRLSTGYAWCNAVNGAQCPDIEKCIKDEEMQIIEGADVVQPAGAVPPVEETKSGRVN